jgi:fucose permease
MVAVASESAVAWTAYQIVTVAVALVVEQRGAASGLVVGCGVAAVVCNVALAQLGTCCRTAVEYR